MHGRECSNRSAGVERLAIASQRRFGSASAASSHRCNGRLPLHTQHNVEHRVSTARARKIGENPGETPQQCASGRSLFVTALIHRGRRVAAQRGWQVFSGLEYGLGVDPASQVFVGKRGRSTRIGHD